MMKAISEGGVEEKEETTRKAVMVLYRTKRRKVLNG